MQITSAGLSGSLSSALRQDGLQSQAAVGMASKVLKDTTASQVITQTLDKLNTGQSLSGPVVNADYQLQKDVLGAANLGKNLDLFV